MGLDFLSEIFRFIDVFSHLNKLSPLQNNGRTALYHDFFDRGLQPTRKLLAKVKSSLRMCYGRHHDLVNRNGIFVSQQNTDMFHLS